MNKKDLRSFSELHLAKAYKAILDKYKQADDKNENFDVLEPYKVIGVISDSTPVQTVGYTLATGVAALYQLIPTAYEIPLTDWDNLVNDLIVNLIELKALLHEDA